MNSNPHFSLSPMLISPVSLKMHVVEKPDAKSEF